MVQTNLDEVVDVGDVGHVVLAVVELHRFLSECNLRGTKLSQSEERIWQ